MSGQQTSIPHLLQSSAVYGKHLFHVYSSTLPPGVHPRIQAEGGVPLGLAISQPREGEKGEWEHT